MRRAEARCHLIASVLAADGLMGQGERDLLDYVMDHWQLDTSERRRVTTFERQHEAMAIIQASPPQEREALINECLAAALADGKIAPQEQLRIQQLTAALGLP